MEDEEFKRQIKEMKQEVEYYKSIAAQAGSVRLRENEEFRNLLLRNKQTEEVLKNTNVALSRSVIKLKRTQAQLIESEKNAALSGLVAGVAHEINTPIGISITAASHLEDQGNDFFNKVEGDGLSRSDFDAFKASTLSSTNILLTNLLRAADLIKSFKQVAIDQTSDEKRVFNLKEYIQEVLKSLQPEYKRFVQGVLLRCDNDIKIESYPGVFSQIITNLIMNSLIHGFENIDCGEISINADKKGSSLFFEYSDNGKGMSDESLKKLYDPFYTTKRGQGGTGLGMHIVYNLVKQKLKGQIDCESVPDKGTTIRIKIPINSDS